MEWGFGGAEVGWGSGGEYKFKPVQLWAWPQKKQAPSEETITDK